MKTAVVLSVLATCLITPALASAQYGRVPRSGACFYRDSDFRGQSFCIDAGQEERRLPGGLRNEVSSIRTFGNVEVVVYENSDFEGRSLRFTSDVRDLQRENFNDKVSSVQVRGRGYGGGRPGRPTQDPDVIIRRAYQDLLDREPDQQGLRNFRRRIIDDGWTEQDVRTAIRDSPEYRERTTMTPAKAQEIVRRAYLAVLNREPDPGSRGYVDRVLRDRWTQQDVERELRRSPEYLNRPR
jgi:hypothetical protein